MKKLLYRIIPIFAVLAAFVSCRPEEKVNIPVIQAENLEIEGDEAVYRLPYTIENPVVGKNVNAVTGADWITEINPTVTGAVSFKAARNEGAPRTAEMLLLYEGAQDVTVTITQLTYDPDAEKDFVIEVGNISPYGCTVTYTPKKYQGNYFFIVMDKEDMDPYINGDLEALYLSDLEWLKMQAEYNGMSLQEFLPKAKQVYALDGTVTEMNYTTLDPKTDYYAYCYGLSVDGEMLTDICYKEFRTEIVDPVDLTFTVKAENITESAADLYVTPSSDEHTYYWTYISSFELAKYGKEEVMKMMIENLKDYAAQSGTDLSEWIHTGASSEKLADLWANTTYYVVAWGMDAKGTPTTEAQQIEAFTTQATAVTDDCTFEISCPAVEAMDIQVNVKPSSSETRYYIAVIDEDKCEGYNDDQMATRVIRMEAQRLAEGYYGEDVTWENAPFFFTGEQTKWAQRDLYWTFKPNHNYHIYVFGVDNNGAISTKVARKDQMTGEADESNMTFEVETVEMAWDHGTFKIIPSNNDEYYLPFMIEKQYLEYYRNEDGTLDEEALMEEIEHYYDNAVHYYLHRGEWTGYFSWVSNREQVLLLCGFAGTNTTKFYEFHYTSPEIPFTSDADLEAEYHLFDGADLVEMDPEYWAGSEDDCVMYIKFYPNDKAVHWYGGVWPPVDNFEAGIDHLLHLIMIPEASFVDQTSGRIRPWFNNTWSFSYCAEGEDGAFGPWHYEEFTPVRGENMEEPWDFWSNPDANAQIMSISKESLRQAQVLMDDEAKARLRNNN